MMSRVSGEISLTYAELVAKADALDVEVVVGEVELFAEGDEGVAVAEEDAEDVRELDDHLAGEVGLGADERGDGVEGVEEEVRVDLALQGVEAGFEQEAGLLFELVLDADGVPDFERDADDDRRAGADGELHEPGAGVELEVAARVEVREEAGGVLRRHDEDEEKHLAVEVGPGDGAANPAVEAEVDEWGEGPDVFFAGDAAVGSEDGGDEEVDGEREVLVVGEGGEREGGAAEHGGPGAEKEAEDGNGLEGDVRCEKVLDFHADEHTEHEGMQIQARRWRVSRGGAVLEEE